MNYRETNSIEVSPTDRRWSWLEVDLDAIRHNINTVKNTIGSKCKLMVVVKADAYGHGAIQIAKTATNCGAAYLGVATVDEAVDIRKAGINTDILILSQPPASAISLLLEYNIMPAIYTPEFAIQYAEAADKQLKIARYHLAVNTGMNRVGVRYNEVTDFIKSVSFHRALELVGIFTHFATADCADGMDFEKQLHNFNTMLDNLKINNIDPGIVHAANSAAIFRYPQAHFDMVRAGICIYGQLPSELFEGKIELDPALSIHARIIDERILGLGEGVSYGQKYRSRSSVKICTIPIGYADGLHRNASGKIGIIYKGRVFPQVGSICMDMCMFEIDMNSAVSQERFNAQIGDEVMLVGTDGQATITLDSLAKTCGTINYEIACSFSRRMPVVYK